MAKEEQIRNLSDGSLYWHINVPNAITTTRVGFAFAVIGLIVLGSQTQILIAGVLLTLGWITDGLDGFFARKLGQSTLSGALFDLVADRLLMTPALLVMVIGGHWSYGATFMPFSPYPYAVVVIAADLTVLVGIAVFVIKRMKRNIEFPAPTMLARITYSIQMPTLIVGVLGIGNHILLDILMYLTIITTLAASFSYLKKGGYVFTS